MIGNSLQEILTETSSVNAKKRFAKLTSYIVPRTLYINQYSNWLLPLRLGNW